MTWMNWHPRLISLPKLARNPTPTKGLFARRWRRITFSQVKTYAQHFAKYLIFLNQKHHEANGAWPKRNRKLKEDVDTVGADSYILLSDEGRAQATPSAVKEPRRTWERGVIDNNPKRRGSGFDSCCPYPTSWGRERCSHTHHG